MLIKRIIVFPFKIILNYSIKFFILFHGIIKILLNYKKIYRSKYIILHTDYLGFAHTIIIPDFIRSFKNKNDYLYILFFEFGRHNYYQQYLHNINQINIYSSFSINNFKYRFGEYEKIINNNNYVINLIKLLIFKIKNKKTKIFNASEFWERLFKTNQKKINSFLKKFYFNKNFNSNTLKDNQISYDLQRTILIHLICKNNTKYKLPKFFDKKVFRKIPKLEKNKNKLLTIYIRSKRQNLNSDFFNNARNSDCINYLDVTKYFIKIGWKVILIGDDYIDLVSKLKNNENLIYADKYSISKRLLDIFSMTTSDLIISTLGGANMLSFYKHTIYVNMFPIGHIPANYKMNELFQSRRDFILNKNVYFKGKKITSDKKLKNLLYKSYLSKQYLIKQNTGKEILNFCKKHYKKHYKQKDN